LLDFWSAGGCVKRKNCVAYLQPTSQILIPFILMYTGRFQDVHGKRNEVLGIITFLLEWK
jgi:hypothetical protein